jgi:hypothetical protein
LSGKRQISDQRDIKLYPKLVGVAVCVINRVKHRQQAGRVEVEMIRKALEMIENLVDIALFGK